MLTHDLVAIGMAFFLLVANDIDRGLTCGLVNDDGYVGMTASSSISSGLAIRMASGPRTPLKSQNTFLEMFILFVIK